jgi:carboxymethylenebutenolidase
MPTTRIEKISAPDGGTFDGDVVVPDAGSGPGLLLLQEVFGVNAYLRDVAERLARLGYVVLMPDVFWRIEPRVSLHHDEASMQTAFGYMGRFLPLWDQAIGDLDAAMTHLRGLPEVTGGVGVLGFCLGGRLAYSVAARSAPDVAVSYYGAGIAGALEEGDRISCPVLFHFGTADQYIPMEQITAIVERFGSRPNVEIALHDGAGHAFDNHLAPMFHQPEPARVAWDQTVRFLADKLPA